MDPRMSLPDAVRANDVNMVKTLLENGADINERNAGGDAPLHIAVNRENYDMVKLLVDNGATVDIQNNDGKTPLYIAVIHDCSKIVELLLDAGADIRTFDFDLDEDGNSFLDNYVGESMTPYNPNFATFKQHVEKRKEVANIVAMLLRKGATFNPEKAADIAYSIYSPYYPSYDSRKQLDTLMYYISKAQKNQTWRRRRNVIIARHHTKQWYNNNTNSSNNNNTNNNNKLPPLEYVGAPVAPAMTPVEAAMKAFRNLGYRTGSTRKPRKLSKRYRSTRRRANRRRTTRRN